MSYYHLCWLIPLLIVLFPFLFPYRALRILVFILRYTTYNVKISGLDNLPRKGPALLVVNHVSIFDSLILMGMTKRKIRVMMHQEFYRLKLFHSVFRRMGYIEVPNSGQPKKMREFLSRTRALLRRGEIVCVFPEGSVSGNGLILRFKKGIYRMLPDDVQVPIIPIRLGMLWGSLFSFDNAGKMHFTLPRQFPIPVSISVHPEVPHDRTPYQLRQLISEMGAEAELARFPGERTLHYAFARRTKWHPLENTFRDFNGAAPSNFVMLTKILILSRLIRKIDKENNSKYIGVFLPNCTNATAVIHGILFADRVPAVMNFTAGSAALEKAAETADLKIILTSRKFLQKLGMEPMPQMLMLEDVAKDLDPKLKRDAILDILFRSTSSLMKKYAPLSKDNLNAQAVLLFSSGSTGIPKGIMLSHHNLNSNFFSFWRIINWTPRDRVVGNLPLFHAYGFMIGFVLSSLVGTRSIYLPNPLDAAGVCSLCEKEKPTLLMATPTFLQHYMRKYKSGQFSSLRIVITGAEKLRHDISRKFKELTGLTIVEGFGCTELSPIVTINLSYNVFSLGRESGMPDSVGAPLPGIHVKIVDPDTMEELPENTPGLMLVKGALVMQGYLNDPEATAKAIQNGYYNTGDIASMSPDGYLTIKGRLARFSKIAGEMVPHELVEKAINEVLQTEDRCVAVCGARDSKRGERLVVFYSTDELNPAAMIEELKKREMPNLWIPKAADFTRLDLIPLLGTGKVDLQKLKRIAETLAV